jgi:FtsH-binding integral membrane protein
MSVSQEKKTFQLILEIMGMQLILTTLIYGIYPITSRDTVIGINFVIISLAGVYYLIRKPRKRNQEPE